MTVFEIALLACSSKSLGFLFEIVLEAILKACVDVQEISRFKTILQRMRRERGTRKRGRRGEG